MMTLLSYDVEELTKEYADNFARNHKTYLKPNIPEWKLQNAIDHYAQDVVKEEVIALGDFTVLQSAKRGFIITPTAFYFQDLLDSSMKINYKDLTQIITQPGENKIIFETGIDKKVINNVMINHEILKEYFDYVIELK